MSLEPYYSLRAAARELGISRQTLNAWIGKMGLRLPPIERGSHAMIPESILRKLAESRAPKSDG